jgi:hypothetical protein
MSSPPISRWQDYVEIRRKAYRFMGLIMAMMRDYLRQHPMPKHPR